MGQGQIFIAFIQKKVQQGLLFIYWTALVISYLTIFSYIVLSSSVICVLTCINMYKKVLWYTFILYRMFGAMGENLKENFIIQFECLS